MTNNNFNDALLLKPFSLTYVVYNKHDKYIGFIMSLFTLLPVFLVVMYVTLIISKRNLHTIYVFLWEHEPGTEHTIYDFIKILT